MDEWEFNNTLFNATDIGNSFDSNKFTEANNDSVPYIQGKDIKNNTIEYENVKYLPSKLRDKEDIGLCKLISLNENNLGNSFYVEKDKKAILSDDVLRLSTFNDITKDYRNFKIHTPNLGVIQEIVLEIGLDKKNIDRNKINTVLEDYGIESL